MGASTLFLSIVLILIPFILVVLLSTAPNSPEENPIIPKGKLGTPALINVYRQEFGVTEPIPFEDYVKGVVSGEMPSSFEIEALKAQAVAARTYSLSKILRSGTGGNPAAHPQAPLCDTTHCQVYRSVYDLEKIKSSEWMSTGWTKIQEAVDKTKGEMMYYKGSLAEQALFHSSSGGKTENSEEVFASAVPYLRSVGSPYEEGATHQGEATTITLLELASKLHNAFPNIQAGNFTSAQVKVLNRSAGNRVNQIQVGSGIYTGRNIRDALGLSSANFQIQAEGNNITFTTVGYGHGVGMSQYGANGMAKKGSSYKQILCHYYSGTAIY